jgi:hypothetical protein
MKITGFNFTKILVEKPAELKTKFSVNNHIEFLEVEKEEIEFMKDTETVRIKFKFMVSYDPADEKEKKKDSKANLGNLVFEGIILLALDKEQSKELIKSWKKKELSSGFKIPLFNVVLRKCTPKALDLEDQLGLPFHIPLPKITPQKKE